jgi:hypothetical protein
MNPFLVTLAFALVVCVFAYLSGREAHRADAAEQELAEYRLGEAERLARALEAQKPRGGKA